MVAFTEEQVQRIYSEERWSRKRFETAYPGVSWQAFLYYKGKYRMPTRTKYSPNDAIVLSPLTERERDMLTGSLLGDGTLLKHKGGSVYFRMTHSVKQSAYLDWKREQFSRIILTKEPHPQSHYHKGVHLGDTLMHTAVAVHELRDWERDWYTPNGAKRRKGIPESYLPTMSELGLAIWLMDDGSCHEGNITFATYAFSQSDLDTLRLYLMDRWGLVLRNEGSKQGIVLRLTRPDSRKLANLVAQYVIPEMRYKLGSVSESVETIRLGS